MSVCVHWCELSACCSYHAAHGVCIFRSFCHYFYQNSFLCGASICADRALVLAVQRLHFIESVDCEAIHFITKRGVLSAPCFSSLALFVDKPDFVVVLGRRFAI